MGIISSASLWTELIPIISEEFSKQEIKNTYSNAQELYKSDLAVVKMLIIYNKPGKKLKETNYKGKKKWRMQIQYKKNTPQRNSTSFAFS